MATNNKKALFWTSYSDLMTSLFFAVLVLFVVVVVAVVGGACGAGGEVEVGEVQALATTVGGAAGA